MLMKISSPVGENVGSVVLGAPSVSVCSDILFFGACDEIYEIL